MFRAQERASARYSVRKGILLRIEVMKPLGPYRRMGEKCFQFPKERTRSHHVEISGSQDMNTEI